MRQKVKELVKPGQGAGTLHLGHPYSSLGSRTLVCTERTVMMYLCGTANIGFASCKLHFHLGLMGNRLMCCMARLLMICVSLASCN